MDSCEVLAWKFLLPYLLLSCVLYAKLYEEKRGGCKAQFACSCLARRIMVSTESDSTWVEYLVSIRATKLLKMNRRQIRCSILGTCDWFAARYNAYPAFQGTQVCSYPNAYMCLQTVNYVRYVILTCHSYVTVYIYPRNSHLKSLASYFGLQLFSLSHKQVMGPGL